MVFGHNTSTIDEEFPTPTPVPPGKSVVKRVKIRNEGSVACYIRAALIFSEPIEAIEGLDTENWVKGEDDYYYYKKPVSEGESTTELFTGIRVAKEMEQKELEVSVYEESVQIQKGNMDHIFYIKDGKDGQPPTNWRSYFGGSVWEKIPGYDNKFYLHSFAKNNQI